MVIDFFVDSSVTITVDEVYTLRYNVWIFPIKVIGPRNPGYAHGWVAEEPQMLRHHELCIVIGVHNPLYT